MNALVELRGAGLRYGQGAVSVVAVHDLDLRIDPSTSLAVTGPSGSGKSSLLHLVAGLERPTTGTVSWPGLGGAPRPDPTLVGVVFQAPSLVPTLTAAENVALPILIAGDNPHDADDRAQRALDLLDLGWTAQLLPDELSGGQAQRVALARVLAMQPTLIVADEPTGQLDHLTADHVLDTMLTVADQLKAAVLVSTHDARVAARFTSELPMHNGTLTAPAVRR